MDCWSSFETSSIKRGNQATAAFAKTGTGNLTLFGAGRLPFTSHSCLSFLLGLQLTQIIDDRENPLPHRLLRAAGQIEKRVELALALLQR